jgi:hypothetical protein
MTFIAFVSDRTFQAIRMLQDSEVLVWKPFGLKEWLVCAAAIVKVKLRLVDLGGERVVDD